MQLQFCYIPGEDKLKLDKWSFCVTVLSYRRYYIKEWREGGGTLGWMSGNLRSFRLFAKSSVW